VARGALGLVVVEQVAASGGLALGGGQGLLAGRPHQTLGGGELVLVAGGGSRRADTNFVLKSSSFWQKWDTVQATGTCRRQKAENALYICKRISSGCQVVLRSCVSSLFIPLVNVLLFNNKNIQFVPPA